MTVGQPDINLNTWGITYEVIDKISPKELLEGSKKDPKSKPKKEKKPKETLPKKERARKLEHTPEEEAASKERREHERAVREVKEGDPAKRKEIHDKYRMEDLKQRTDEKRRGRENPKWTKYRSYDENAPDYTTEHGAAFMATQGGHAVTQEAIERKRGKEQAEKKRSRYLGRKKNPDKTREYKEEKQYKQRDEPVMDPKNPKAAQAVRETQTGGKFGNRKVKIPRHADAGDKAGHIGSPDVVPSKTISAAEVKRRAQASFPNPQAKDRPSNRVDTPAKDTREYVTQSVQKTLNGLSSLRIKLAKDTEEAAYKKFQAHMKDPSLGSRHVSAFGRGKDPQSLEDRKQNAPTKITPSGRKSGLNKPAYVPERYNKKPQGKGVTGDIQAASQAKDISAEVRANVKRIKEERSGRKPDQGTIARRAYAQGKDEVPDKVVHSDTKPELYGKEGRQYLQGEGAKEEWEKSQGRGQKYAKPPPKQSKSGHSEEYQTKRTMYLAGMSRQKRTAFNKLSPEEQRKRVMMTRGQKKKSLEEIKADLDRLNL
tara:strand:- start:3811 stop:5433 length:1623 start_codon:yes stop_codon:yes gene_type:complete